MDAQARKKALYRAKLSVSKLEKRIESPLVRYNEFDQPVCRVCDVVLKSESVWPAHQASRKHHEAMINIKANAAGQTRANNVKAESPAVLPKSKPEYSSEKRDSNPEASTELSKARSSSMLPPDFFDKSETKRQSALPPDFFDNSDTKRQKTGINAAKLVNSYSDKKPGGSFKTQAAEPFNSESNIDAFSSANVVEGKMNEFQTDTEHSQTSKIVVGSETIQAKGALPEGFFDDKDADLRARGITPVKLDVKDEYKEFEKLIQEDLKEVDNRLEEEEVDAAEMIEVAESVEQKTYRERVEMLKHKKMELMAARSAANSRGPRVMGKEPDREESSSDDDDDEDFTVDWRAKHL